MQCRGRGRGRRGEVNGGAFSLSDSPKRHSVAKVRQGSVVKYQATQIMQRRLQPSKGETTSLFLFLPELPRANTSVFAFHAINNANRTALPPWIGIQSPPPPLLEIGAGTALPRLKLLYLNLDNC